MSDLRSRRHREYTFKGEPQHWNADHPYFETSSAHYPMASLLVAANMAKAADERLSPSSGQQSGRSPQHSYHPLLGMTTLAFVCVACLFIFGTFMYSMIEGLSIVDSMYLSTGVITTVGLVVVPRTMAGRAFTAFYNFVSLGIGCILLSEIAESRRAWTRQMLSRGAQRSSEWWDLAVSFSAMVTPIATASFVFHFTEGWPLGESLYFCLITASGLGMGDVEPRQWTSRIVFVIYLWYTMGVTLNFMGTFGQIMHDAIQRKVCNGRLRGWLDDRPATMLQESSAAWNEHAPPVVIDPMDGGGHAQDAAASTMKGSRLSFIGTEVTMK